MITEAILKEMKAVGPAPIYQTSAGMVNLFDELAKLLAIEKAAHNMIYIPRKEYKPFSKKAALRQALVAYHGVER